MSPSTRTSAVRELALLRAALLGGVLLFGAVAWFITRERGGAPPNTDPRDFDVFRYIVPALCGGAVAVSIVLRVQLARIREAGRKASFRVVAWGAGEASALAGGVHYFLTGEPKLYVLGVVALLATLIIVPLRES